MANLPMSRPDLMLAQYDERYSTANTFAYLGGKSILRVAGGQNFMRSDDGGLTWGEPWRCAGVEGKPIDHAHSLIKLEGDSVGLGETWIPENKTYKSKIAFRRSNDGGKTWEKAAIISPENLMGFAFASSLIRTSSGRLIYPMYGGVGQGRWRAKNAPFPGGLVGGQFVTTDAHFFDPHFAYAYVMLSDDDGRTWRQNECGELVIHVGSCFMAHATEPSVAEVEPGRLLMFVRTQLGRLYQSWSEDDGNTWSRLQPTALASSPSPARLLRVPDTGHLICIWNQHSPDEIKRGFIRSRLSAAVSRSKGAVWEFYQNVESIHEETRVAPGPIEHVHPQQLYTLAGKPAEEWDTQYVVELPAGYARYSNNTACMCGDRVVVNYSTIYYDELGEEHNRHANRVKVLPLEWFYNGLDRFKSRFVLDKVTAIPPGP